RPLTFYFGMNGEEKKKRIIELLEMIELSEKYYDRYPAELSGGEKQRICIARALAAMPDLIICDEVTSALDVSVQAHVLELLKGTQVKTGAACLFISHDLGVVKQVADETVVLQKGQVVETGITRTVFDHPSHTYTQLLLAAALRREDYADLAAPMAEGS
ncbi:MAG: ATP-binding cassette domain-containing protein, partial [Rhodospirillales bacterium]|nr:ATP-binding cassette domain-containing protein [Rhodospirillales bacterium]